MADSQIYSASTGPTSQTQTALHEVARFAGELSSAVSADNCHIETCGPGQIHSFCEVARSNQQLVIASKEFVRQRTKERHVRRVREIDPDSHEVGKLRMDSFNRLAAKRPHGTGNPQDSFLFKLGKHGKR